MNLVNELRRLQTIVLFRETGDVEVSWYSKDDTVSMLSRSDLQGFSRALESLNHALWDHAYGLFSDGHIEDLRGRAQALLDETPSTNLTYKRTWPTGGYEYGALNIRTQLEKVIKGLEEAAAKAKIEAVAVRSCCTRPGSAKGFRAVAAEVAARFTEVAARGIKRLHEDSALRLGTEVGLHRGGDRGRRWSLSEGQAHLLGGIRRREPSKAAVDDGLQGDGQLQRGGSGRLLGQPLQEAKGQGRGADPRRAREHGSRGLRVESLHGHRCHARGAAALPRVGTPRRNPSCPLQVRPIRAAVVGFLDEGRQGDASQLQQEDPPRVVQRGGHKLSRLRRHQIRGADDAGPPVQRLLMERDTRDGPRAVPEEAQGGLVGQPLSR